MLGRVVSLDGIKIHTRFWDQGISIGGALGRLQACGRVLKPISTALETIARDQSSQGPPNAVCECSVPDRLPVRANAQNETRSSGKRHWGYYCSTQTTRHSCMISGEDKK